MRLEFYGDSLLAGVRCFTQNTCFVQGTMRGSALIGFEGGGNHNDIEVK